MRLFADASVKGGIVRALRASGVSVIYGLEGDHGAPDSVVLSSASVQGLVLLTEDTDFGELVFRDRAASIGVVLIRFDVTTEAEARSAAIRVIDALAKAEGGFTTLTADHARRRALPKS